MSGGTHSLTEVPKKVIHMKDPSALRYQNRLGDIYYLQQGKTSTGKPRYYVGRKLTGTPVSALPDGYEFYERPDNAQVVLRKVKLSSITEFERVQCEEIVRRVSGLKHFVVDIDGDALVVYIPAVSPTDADRFLQTFPSEWRKVVSAKAEEIREVFARVSQYVKTLRFELVNRDKREYRAERWRFRDLIDGWVAFGAGGPLAQVVEVHAKHLGRESFHDLIF